MEQIKTGILYGVGVGPGDPELITLKAIHCIQRCSVIAAPSQEGKEGTAYKIAEQVLDLSQKKLLLLDFPMTKEPEKWKQSHMKAAQQIEAELRQGEDVAFLTLGDPSIYSTYCYLAEETAKLGFETKMIPGIPSFCAVASALNVSLAEKDQPIHIVPASYQGMEKSLHWEGTKVLMKTGRALQSVKEALREAELLECAQMVCNCGMENEKIVFSLKDTEQEAGYFSIILAR